MWSPQSQSFGFALSQTNKTSMGYGNGSLLCWYLGFMKKKKMYPKKSLDYDCVWQLSSTCIYKEVPNWQGNPMFYLYKTYRQYFLCMCRHEVTLNFYNSLSSHGDLNPMWIYKLCRQIWESINFVRRYNFDPLICMVWTAKPFVFD